MDIATEIIRERTMAGEPDGWRRINGCACTYCNTEVWPSPTVCPECGNDPVVFQHEKTCSQSNPPEVSDTEGGTTPDYEGPSTVAGEPLSSATNPPSASDRFDLVIERLKALRDRKGSDYGTEEDTIANLRAAEDFGMAAWIGCVLRANDKMRRLQTFIKTNRLHCEPADDALEDLAVYTIWAIVLRNEEVYPPGKITTFDP